MTNEVENTITLVALESKNLDTTCYRGTAPLSELTRVSQADTFDQVTNTKGLQRDLTKRHALDCYEYVARPADKKKPRAYPEVVLNARDRKVIDVEVVTELADGTRLVEITFDVNLIDRARSAKVSRIDGNHRLMFSNGDGKDREAIDLPAPFQLHIGLTPEQEAGLFVDMNANQKSLNTSHLAILRSRLTAEEHELVNHPERVYARRLSEDAASPFYGKVYMGGSKSGSKAKDIKYAMTFTALESAVRRMIRSSQVLDGLSSSDATYAAIRNYWQAVAETWGEEFGSDEYLLMKSIGVNSLAQLAPSILDRLYTTTGAFGPLDIAELLAHTKSVYDWHKEAGHQNGVSGMSGNRAVKIIAGRMADELPAVKPAGRRAAPKPAPAEAEGEELDVPDAVVVE